MSPLDVQLSPVPSLRQRPAWRPWALAGTAVAAMALGACYLWGLCGAQSDAELLASAGLRLARQDPAGALIDARNLLQRQPGSAQARLIVSRALLDQGDPAGAGLELQRAQELGLRDDDVVPARAAILLSQGRPDAVVAQFGDRILPDRLKAADLQSLVAQAQLNLGKPGAAMAAVEAALTRDPEHPSGQVLRARLLALRGEVANAQAAVDGLLQKQPELASAWLLRGDLLALATKDTVAALPAYQKAVDLNPRLPEAHAALVWLLLQRTDIGAAAKAADRMRSSLPASPLAIYLQALTAYLQNDFNLARSRLQLLDIGESPRLLMLSGTVESRLGNLVQADALLSKAIQLLPDEPKPRHELATVHLLRGQPERALAVLDPLLKSGSRDPDGWRLAGQSHLRLGDFARAEQAFQRVRQIRPDDKSVALDTGRLLLARGDFDAGLRQLEAAAKADPGQVMADLELIAGHMTRGDTAAALAAADAALHKQPESAALLLVKGRVHQAAGQQAAARQAFEAALKKQPDHFGAVRSLAELDLAESRADQARSRYQDLLKRDPRSAAALLAMADIARRTGASRIQAAEWVDKAVQVNTLDADIWRAAIEFHRDGGDIAGALARARSAHAALPDNLDLLALLAGALLAEGDHQQAIIRFSQLIDRRPRSAEAHLLLAEAQLVAQRPDRAQAAAETARALAPDWVPATQVAVRAALANQRPAEALALARTWQQRRPHAPIGWHLEGEIAMSQNRWEAAATALRTAMSKSPSSDLAWGLYVATLRAGHDAEARKQADAWLRAHPDDVTFIGRLGEAAQAKGDLPEAQARFRQALKLQPDSPMLLNNLAFALVLGKDPSAMEPAMKAFDLAPYSPAILDTLAHAFALQGKLAKAADVQALAVEMAPKSTAYRLSLARLLLQSGDKPRAQDVLLQLQRQLGSSPPPPELGALLAQAKG